MANFSDRLRRAREKRGLTLRELAKLAEVDHAWIHRIESGERHNIAFPLVVKLADALRVSLDYLAGRDKRRYERDEEVSKEDVKGSDLEPASVV